VRAPPARGAAEQWLTRRRARADTPFDYADILDHVLQRWGVGNLRVGATGEAAEAQQLLMAQPARIRRMAEVAVTRRKRASRPEAPPVTQQFSWVFDRPVLV
jgi:acyl-[acyl-carrier-protein] desaturase